MAEAGSLTVAGGVIRVRRRQEEDDRLNHTSDVEAAAAAEEGAAGGDRLARSVTDQGRPLHAGAEALGAGAEAQTVVEWMAAAAAAEVAAAAAAAAEVVAWVAITSLPPVNLILLVATWNLKRWPNQAAAAAAAAPPPPLPRRARAAAAVAAAAAVVQHLLKVGVEGRGGGIGGTATAMMAAAAVMAIPATKTRRLHKSQKMERAAALPSQTLLHCPAKR